MSGAKEIVESIAELFVATAGSASASSIACWRGVRRPNGRRGDQYLIQLSRRPPEISVQSFSDCGRSRCDHRAVFSGYSHVFVEPAARAMCSAHGRVRAAVGTLLWPWRE